MGGGPGPARPEGARPAEKTCFFAYKKSGWQKKTKPPKIQKNRPKFWTLFFDVFLTFFQISSRTWGINFDTIACVFEPVYGPKKNSFFFDRFFFFFQNDLGIKNFLANRPS